MSKRKHNLRLIKAKDSYSTKEIVELLAVHAKTAQNWLRDETLAKIEGIYPPVVRGIDLKEFLTKRILKSKVTLANDEFYCPHCKGARKSRIITIESNGIILGKDHQKITIKGKCEICMTQLNRFDTQDNYNLRQQEPISQDKHALEARQQLNLFG